MPFDLASFNILIKNIALHNINKVCFNWINSWLTNIHKKVISKGLASERKALHNIVLFNISINDLGLEKNKSY